MTRPTPIPLSNFMTDVLLNFALEGFEKTLRDNGIRTHHASALSRGALGAVLLLLKRTAPELLEAAGINVTWAPGLLLLGSALIHYVPSQTQLFEMLGSAGLISFQPQETSLNLTNVGPNLMGQLFANGLFRLATGHEPQPQAQANQQPVVERRGP